MKLILVVKRLTENTTVDKIKLWETYIRTNGIKSIDAFAAKMRKNQIINVDANLFFIIPLNFKTVDRSENSFEDEYCTQKKICFSCDELKMKSHREFQGIEHGRSLLATSISQFGKQVLASSKEYLCLCVIGVDSIVSVIRLLTYFNNHTKTVI